MVLDSLRVAVDFFEVVVGGFRSFHGLVFTLSCVKVDVYAGC